MIRATALANGVALPETGSFRDAVLHQMLVRDRNARFTEVAVLSTHLERIAELLICLIQPPDAARTEALAELRTESNELLEQFAAELYQERYLPEYVRAQAETARRKAQAVEDQRRRDAIAVAKVAKMGKPDDSRRRRRKR